MDRRTFLKIAGAGSFTFAAGCTSQPAKFLYSLVHAPDDMVTGEPTWYASTCRECPAGCGVLAKNHEGRIIKVEGNPLHPINQGRLCMRGQAALQAVYNPDRIKTPLLKEGGRWQPLSFVEAETIFAGKAKAAAERGRGRVRLVTELVGESLLNLMKASLHEWNSEGLLIFELYAYESLKAANRKAFGFDGLLSYHMEQADFLVALGADFLETWLSPVEYARKFKEMHALRGESKALFFHMGPYLSLTGANADLWIPCNPDTEYAIVLGLLRDSLRHGKGKPLPERLRAEMERIAEPFRRERVGLLSGAPLELYDKLLTHLLRAEKPLVLGTGTGAAGPHVLQTNTAANLLNLVLDPELHLLDFADRHRLEKAAARREVISFFGSLADGSVDLLILNNVNPAYALPGVNVVRQALKRDSLYVVSFSNFMDETTELADLILPVRLPLETWDEYSGKENLVSTLQPAMGSLTGAPNLGDVLLRAAFGGESPYRNYKTYLSAQLAVNKGIRDEKQWLMTLQQGGLFPNKEESAHLFTPKPSIAFAADFAPLPAQGEDGLVLIAAPSIRFFDGRGANRPWLCEVPDPLTEVAWQTPVLVHPEILTMRGWRQGDMVRIESQWGALEAPVYTTERVKPGILVMAIGQGHTSYGRYARGVGLNPFSLLPSEFEDRSGAPLYAVRILSAKNTGRSLKFAHTDGSQIQYGRKIALSVALEALNHGEARDSDGLGMWEFPFTMPLPEGYDQKRRDFYPPHQHIGYRWAMVVDLDRCIGCAACAAACYAENNLGVVGERHIIEGREMAWLQVQRYEYPEDRRKVIFFPMLCQHCDNAPCESVCPVFAPHHNKEGINNQIYNRCIGTRFCSQDCPYKVRRFNWFDWQWPSPLDLQLNPDVTVRSKGVMEKCSFCIQRIKAAHNAAKNEGRKIRDGEVQPACVQTCPAGVFTFGNLMDENSQVRKKVADTRAYQVMGYLNTKPAVIYLKKVVQEV